MIHVVIIDPDEIVRIGIKAILSSAPDIEVVGEAKNAHDGLDILMSTMVTVLITELSSGGKNSMDIIRRAKDHDPSIRVLILTVHGSVDFASRALSAGASGFLAKDAAATQIIIAVRRLAQGRVFISEELVEQLALKVHEVQPSKSHKSLTDRELDVFLRIAKGETNTKIASALSLSVKTISTHRSRIMEKMDLASTADIVQYALAHKLVPVLNV